MTRPRILVVEDEAIVARDIQHQLAEGGYHPVGHTSRAEEVLPLVAELRPDLVLMDIHLAGQVDGIEAAQNVRDEFAIPVIFLTAFAGNKVLSRAKLAEPFGYIVKPFSEQEMFTTIELALHKHQVETRLRNIYAEQAAILRSALDGFWVVDSGGRLIEVNESACRTTGYTREELLRMSLADLMPGQTAEHIAEGMRQTIQTGSARFERQQRCKDGRVIDVEVSVNYIPNDGGRFFCFHRDITERKRMEKRLLDALNYAQTIIEHSPTGIITYTAAGETVTANAAAASIVGATVEQLQANNFRQLESWRNSGLLAAAERALEVKERQVIEAHFTTTFGKEVWLTCRFEPFLYEGSSHLLMMLSDVMEERRAEEQLRLQSSALEAAANAIVITDSQGVVLWANPAFTTFTGYELSEVVGQNPRLLKSGRHDEAFYQNLWETIRSGRVWHGEMINRRKDGSDYQEEMTITPVKNQWGEVTNFIAVKQDITQRRALEEQFRQAQKMDAFGQLAGGVAHDFNNILAVIMMQADLLQVDASKGDTAGMALEIGQAAKRGADLTRQLLLFSRRQTLNTHPLDLNDTVTNLTKMLRRIVGEHIEMGIETAGSPLWVNADSGMLDQVLMNLVVNARDAMPGGGRLRIETAAAHLDAEAAQRFGQEGRPGPFACLSVKDEGCGIKREYLDRIFEPFFTTKEVGKGTGLGLATVFGIVRQHQGWIGVSSEVGKGSTFRVFLPRLNNGDDPVSADASSQTPHAKRETVLIVEDEKPLRSLMSNALTRLGYRVLEAASCVEALEIWRGAGNDVELLITDLVMPGELNGKELARQFCRERPGLKVIYTSGYSTDVTGTDLKLTEGINFLSKPFTLQHLAEILRRRFDQ